MTTKKCLHSFPHRKPGVRELEREHSSGPMATRQCAAAAGPTLRVRQRSPGGLDHMLWETADPVQPGGE